MDPSARDPREERFPPPSGDAIGGSYRATPDPGHRTSAPGGSSSEDQGQISAESGTGKASPTRNAARSVRVVAVESTLRVGRCEEDAMLGTRAGRLGLPRRAVA